VYWGLSLLGLFLELSVPDCIFQICTFYYITGVTPLLWSDLLLLVLQVSSLVTQLINFSLQKSVSNNIYPSCCVPIFSLTKFLFWFLLNFQLAIFVYHQINPCVLACLNISKTTLVYLSSSRAFKQYQECKWVTLWFGRSLTSQIN